MCAYDFNGHLIIAAVLMILVLYHDSPHKPDRRFFYDIANLCEEFKAKEDEDFSERSFSALHRVNNYLRSTVSQTRLNNLMVLHVHKEHTDKLKDM